MPGLDMIVRARSSQTGPHDVGGGYRASRTCCDTVLFRPYFARTLTR